MNFSLPKLLSLNSKRVIWLVLVGLFVPSLLMLRPISHGLNQLELRSFNARQATVQESRQHTGISLIELDNTISNPDLMALFGRFPFRRDLYAYVISFLDRAPAKRLLIDMSFTGGGDPCFPEADANFAQAVTESNIPVLSVLGIQGQEDSDKAILTDAERHAVLSALAPEFLKKAVPKQFAMHYFTDIKPSAPALLESSMRFYPASNVQYDANGHARRIALFSTLRGKLLLPNLMPAALLNAPADVETTREGRVRLGEHWIDTHGEHAPIIRWYGNIRPHDPKQTSVQVYPRYPIWQVIQSELYLRCQEDSQIPECHQVQWEGFTPLNPAAFQDRYVLLGVTAGSFTQDNHPTLYDSAYPGVYIQAAILDNLLHNDFVRRPGWRVAVPRFLSPLYGEDSISLVTVLTTLLMMGLATYACLRWTSIHLLLVGILFLSGAYAYLTMWVYQHWNLWLNWIYPTAGILIATLGAILYRYLTAEKRKQQLRFAFGKYVSPAVMQTIEQDPTGVRLGGQRQELTILFSDIRGFTTMSEQYPPEVVQNLLTRYFSTMNGIILQEHQGTINKLIGDAIMAYWGFPLANQDHAFQAVCAAMAMRDAMAHWETRPGEPELQIGVGINTGEAMVGNVGSEDFMDFTVIGDAVNLASRLEGANKEFGTTIVISSTTYDKVSDRVEARFLGTIQVKGKDQPVDVYEPLKLKPLQS